MTKFFISVKALSAVALSGVLIFSIGCNNNNQPDVSPVSSVAKTEYTSEIDQMEKEEGVTFFKKDVWIKDEAGKNQVLMRFASKNQSALNAYLLDYNYTIEPIIGVVKDETEKIVNSGTQVSGNPQNVQNNAILANNAIVTEVISRKLSANVSSFSTIVSFKKERLIEPKNGRIAAYSYNRWVTHLTTTNWPAWATVTLVRYSRTYDQCSTLEFGVDQKNCVLCQWYSLDSKPWDKYKIETCNIYTTFAGQISQSGPMAYSSSATQQATMSGSPYRARVNVQSSTSDDYSVDWVR
jgi:hypothetical protein